MLYAFMAVIKESKKVIISCASDFSNALAGDSYVLIICQPISFRMNVISVSLGGLFMHSESSGSLEKR